MTSLFGTTGSYRYTVVTEAGLIYMEPCAEPGLWASSGNRLQPGWGRIFATQPRKSARPVAVKADASAGGLITGNSYSEAPETGAEATPCLGDDSNLLAAQLKSSQLLSSFKEAPACSNSNLLNRLRLEICAVAPLLDSEPIRICT